MPGDDDISHSSLGAGRSTPPPDSSPMPPAGPRVTFEPPAAGIGARRAVGLSINSSLGGVADKTGAHSHPPFPKTPPPPRMVKGRRPSVFPTTVGVQPGAAGSRRARIRSALSAVLGRSGSHGFDTDGNYHHGDGDMAASSMARRGVEGHEAAAGQLSPQSTISSGGTSFSSADAAAGRASRASPRRWWWS